MTEELCCKRPIYELVDKSRLDHAQDEVRRVFHEPISDTWRCSTCGKEMKTKRLPTNR